MGFTPAYINQGHMQGWERLPAAAITPKVGMALVFSSGKLTSASGSTKPQYISMMESSAQLTAGTEIPVIRVQPDALYAVPSAIDSNDAAIGAMVQIASGGMGVNKTTSGPCEIVSKPATAKTGDIIIVRIP